jgi:hypothetical protein
MSSAAALKSLLTNHYSFIDEIAFVVMFEKFAGFDC